MSQFFQIHPDNPQLRLVRQAVDIIRDGGVIAYPTDSAYALGCHIGDKKAVERIRQIRRLDERHNFTLVCRDLSELATYAQVNNTQYRMLKNHTPGPYTFILKGSREVPRRLMHPKRKTIGIRVPECPIVQSLLSELGCPIMSSTLQLPGDEFPMMDPYDIRMTLEAQLDLIIDGGYRGMEPTTVVSLMGDVPEILRVGKGNPEPFTID
ncbi:L-threonylcarbamoyladenylate synthase [Endozoicomonas sp. SCSIO W0465]|uniref:L-threonylcarbamoyladenylate synthase n=1 Tax=Endozoicomonas sp. SCSIO W0465 TaxID=2918516 RepID=UPI002075AB59|nr:L-threonylcarbamoyladenylate synthase [Endozoicomonas sp. SCSIO W0465]USE39687.1 threonylcarbamoyl-AMP synthase [Endozoicomonas sp. SCSIO W0465]